MQEKMVKKALVNWAKQPYRITWIKYNTDDVLNE
jgi:hypothetical protein